MAWITASVDGTEPPGLDFMQPIWDAWNARSPEEQATGSILFNESVVERFENLTDEELARTHLNLFGMELDGSGLPRLRLAEHALHTWDIAVALDSNARVLPDAVDLLIDTLGFLASHVGKPQGKRFRLRVVTNEPDRNFSLKVDDAVALTDWEGGPTDGELRIPAEAFLRLVYGRLDPASTPIFQVTGPATLDDLRLVFPNV
jgi:hypothetical protein